MRQLIRPLFVLALTLWVGALWTVGGIVAPTLFSTIADRALAGQIAGRLFSIVGWLGVGCAVYLMLSCVLERGVQAFKGATFWIVLLMFMLTVASVLGIQPLLVHLKEQALPREVMESVMRDRFATWHGVSSILYLLQSALGGALVVLEGASPRR
ncbi:DUF4149 domain-containing protein [Niveibacterium sp. 24ML]|uniref:DUF4149 domain-containing protein n=1 Tax=Niveibacterium sp. 24ML TaxID=2985512 RepID=UPI002270C189|nr:DUF4149 domain-containing protein [Niveibacterium sp. 24ML]MCX9155173.1 DUF4149 domain-containing protein [Niveibacterium sp. 24ML]